MRIGIVVEGSSEEAGDVHAVKTLCRRIASEWDLVRECFVVAGTSKPNILEDAGKHVASLREQGCERVIILWDNCPPWNGDLDAEALTCARGAWDKVEEADQDTANIFMVCSRRELEAWLLTDKAPVIRVLKNIRNVKMPNVSGSNNPDRISKPKDQLHDWFYKVCGRPPFGREYAAICETIRFRQLRRSESFNRFEEAVRRP